MLNSKQLLKKSVSVLLSLVIILSLSVSLSATAGVSAATKRSSVVKKLTKNYWNYDKMYCNGSKSDVAHDAYQYGGTYIEFKKSKKFYCNLGLDYGCSGKYTVSKKGKVTLHIKKQWDGSGFLKVKKHKSKLKISKNFKTISFSAKVKSYNYKFYFKQ